MSAHEGQQKSTAKSVTARALSVLGVLTAQNPSLTLSEISRACGLPVATVYRLAGELEEARFLERDASGRYSLGVRMWEMGLLTPVHGHLREAAMPFLLNLQYECRETVQLAVCDGVDAVYVEKLSLDTKTPVQSRIGARIPMHATAVGQAILAFSEPSFVDVITSMPLTRFTDATMTTPRAIQKNLAAVRDRGYAISTEEYVMGSTAIAAPVLVAGKVEAAIGIVNYELRDDLERFAPAMVAAATEFGRRLEELANLSEASGKN